MKILVLNWRDTKHPKAGGAEIVTLKHAEGWVKAGHRVVWLTSSYSGALPRENIKGVDIIRMAGSLTIYMIAPLYVLFHGYEYDVIVDEIHGLPFFTPLVTKTPVVAFIHEIAGEIWDYMAPFPYNIFGKILEPVFFYVYKNINFWTDASSTIKELTERGIRKNLCTAIMCPLILSDQNIPIGIPDEKEVRPTYIFVSRVVKMKGIEEVIKSFSFILKEQRDAHLWIVGGGDSEYIQSLQSMVHEYGETGHVKFWGKVTEKEKFRLLRRAHTLLHASVKEGWGLVVLEAASQGTPTVAYNVSGLVDVVIDGETGIVLKDNSPQTMARETMLLYTDKNRYTRYQKEGICWVKKLTWQDAIKQSLSLLQKTTQV